MSIRNRLIGREFREIGPFADALQEGVAEELQPLRDEIQRLRSELEQIRQIAESAQQTAEAAQEAAASAQRTSQTTESGGTSESTGGSSSGGGEPIDVNIFAAPNPLFVGTLTGGFGLDATATMFINGEQSSGITAKSGDTVTFAVNNINPAARLVGWQVLSGETIVRTFGVTNSITLNITDRFTDLTVTANFEAAVQ